MKTHLLTWLLGGGLVASLWIHLLGCPTCDAPPARLQVEDLGLSPQQCQQLVFSCEMMPEGTAAPGATRDAALTRLKEALGEPRPDAARVRTCTDEFVAAQGAMIRSCVESILTVRSVLDDEQIETLRAWCSSSPDGE